MRASTVSPDGPHQKDFVCAFNDLRPYALLFFLGSARCFVFSFRRTGVCLLIFIAKFAFLVVVLGGRNERARGSRETGRERQVMVDSAWRELSANFRSSGAQSCVDQTARKTHSFRDYVTVLFFCVYTVITFRNLLLSESFLSSWRILPEGQTEGKGKYKKKKTILRLELWSDSFGSFCAFDRRRSIGWSH